MFKGAAIAPQRGQEKQAYVAFAPRTSAPESRTTNRPTAEARMSHVHPGARSRGSAGQRTMTARIVSAPRSSSAFARWSVTHSGESSRRTVIPPSTACSGYRTATAIASHRTRRSRRYATNVHRTVMATASPETIARKRCVHSMRVAGSSDGRNWPWQSGQSGQPRPEPVTRTTPPQTTTRNDARRLAYTRAR